MACLILAWCGGPAGVQEHSFHVNSKILTFLPRRVVHSNSWVPAAAPPPFQRSKRLLSRIPFLEPVLVEEVQSVLKKMNHFIDASQRTAKWGYSTIGEKTGGYRPIPNLMSLNQYLKVLSFKMIQQKYYWNGLRP